MRLHRRGRIENGMRHDPKLLAGRSILVVEDEPLIAMGVHDAFRAAGADTFSASGTNDALQMMSPGLSAAV
jgi:CheY-like chemotaxis protein